MPAESDNGGSYWSNMIYAIGVMLGGLAGVFNSIFNSAFMAGKNQSE